MGNMKKLSLLLVLGLMVVVSGCTGTTDGTGDGSLEILVSDAPADIDDFTYLNVELSEIRVFRTGSGFETYQPPVDSFDLTKLKGDNALSLINATLDSGTYTKIEFYVESIEGETANGSVDVQVPSGKLIITKNFEIGPNSTASFVFDINVVKTGQTDNYNLMPVISESGVVGEDLPEGKVKRVSKEHAKKHEKGPGNGPGMTARLTIQEARKMANGTECTENGSLKGTYNYNENSNTWWIDLEMKPGYEQSGCNPACVVYEDENRSEINWRCTGAIPPGNGDAATGHFSMFVTDAPADIGDFSELVVTLSKAMIHKSADGDNGSDGEWLEFGLNISSFDLTQLVNGNMVEVLDISLPAGLYTQIKLEVGGAAGLVDNQTASIFVPSGTLKVIKPFEIKAGGEVEFVFDINVAGRGNGKRTLEYNLLPVIGKSGVKVSSWEEPECGNGLCEVGEDNETCPDDCIIVNETNETVCGDNIIDDDEECDGAELDGKECTDFGYTGGNISCTQGCTFDLSGCVNETAPECGNDACEVGENYTSCPDDCEPPAPVCVPEINCTDYCDNDILFINGTCLDDSCLFANITCEFGCENATCLTNQTI